VIAPIALITFAALAAALGPRLLRRSSWPNRSPRLGILAWQALSVSILAAAVLAGVALAVPTLPVTANLAELLSACGAALRAEYTTPGGAGLSLAGAMLAVCLVVRTGYCLVAGVVSSGRLRRRQRAALALIARRDERLDALVVDHPVVAAYCLPGRHRRVVLTTAALGALDDAQLAAVIAHERAHLREGHHLVLAATAALQRAFPRMRAFRDAHVEATRLVEMLADDLAARSSDRLTIATALVRLAEASTPAAALGAGGSTSLARVRRLVAPAHPLGAARSALTVLAIAAVVALPVALVTVPAAVAATSGLCPIDFSSTVTY